MKVKIMRQIRASIVYKSKLLGRITLCLIYKGKFTLFLYINNILKIKMLFSFVSGKSKKLHLKQHKLIL